MFTNVLSPKTQETLELLGEKKIVSSFYLSGGSACALYLGHRISYDLDFFVNQDFSTKEIINLLTQHGEVEIFSEDKNTLHCLFNQTRLTFLGYKYPLLKPPSQLYGVNISSLIDVLATKLDTISSRGSKKDFIDLYFFLQEKQYTLKNLFTAFQKKYKGIDYNPVHMLKSLVYFEDADKEAMPTMLKSIEWKEVKIFLEREVRQLTV